MTHDHRRQLRAGSQSAAGAHRGRVLAVLAITLGILVTEVVGGVLAGSLALLADAGHVAADAAGIGMSLLAVTFAARPATPSRTYGHYRLEILAAVLNGVLLFGVAALVLVEAVRRLLAPPEVESGLMAVFGAVALAGNAASLRLLRHAQREALPLRGAFLEVLGDLLGAVAVLLAAAVIAATGWRRADPVASALVGLLILPRTWRLLRDAVDVLLEATPKGVDLAEVRRHVVAVPGVADVHDLHVWTITSGMNVVSAHVVLAEGATPGAVLDSLCDCLGDHFDIEHSTFQLEQPEHRGHESPLHQ